MSIPDIIGGSVLQLEVLGLFLVIVPLLPLILIIAGVWKTFEKADQPGWAAIIPIFNLYVLLNVVGRPVWWLILFFVPIINVIVGVILCVDTAKAFGKGVGYALGLFFLPFVFWPLIGFGAPRYQGAPN